MKKVLSLALVLVMMLSLFAGCGSKAEPAATEAPAAAPATEAAPEAVPAEEVVITFGIHVANPESQEAVTYQIVEAFNAANAGKYRVEFQAADTESHKKNMKLQAADGTLPEVFWMDASQAPEYAEAGALLDVTGGFLWGFPVASLVYWALERLERLPAMVAGQIACYGCGCWWFSQYAPDSGFGAAMLVCVVPYLIPDGIKLWLAYHMSQRLRRHLPK